MVTRYNCGSPQTKITPNHHAKTHVNRPTVANAIQTDVSKWPYLQQTRAQNDARRDIVTNANRRLPREFGQWSTVFRQFSLWSKKGLLERLFKALSRGTDMEWLFIDGSIVKAHQHSSGAASLKGEAIGQSRGATSPESSISGRLQRATTSSNGIITACSCWRSPSCGCQCGLVHFCTAKIIVGILFILTQVFIP